MASKLLREWALANLVDRDFRDMLPFYEDDGFDRPLVVPLRFHPENGAADDLIPISTK